MINALVGECCCTLVFHRLPVNINQRHSFSKIIETLFLYVCDQASLVSCLSNFCAVLETV